jgi:ribosomal protein S18 acetylase RimI-like enzyme
MLGVNIRPYRSGDYDQVFRLWETSGLELSRSDTKESLDRQAERDPDLFLVAEENGRIVGVIMGRWDGRRGWLNRLAVTPEQRHKRLGTRLVMQAEELLKAKSCEKVNLLIESGNAGVQEFYQQMGYSNDDLIFMEKWLVTLEDKDAARSELENE